MRSPRFSVSSPEPELGQDRSDRQRACVPAGLAECGERQELPHAVSLAEAPGAVGHEAELLETRERFVHLCQGEPEPLAHADAAVEGGSPVVGGEREQGKDGRRVWPQALQPAVMQQTGLEPAEGLARPTQQVRAGRAGRGSPHRERERALVFFFAGSLETFFFAREEARRASRSLASLTR